MQIYPSLIHSLGCRVRSWRMLSQRLRGTWREGGRCWVCHGWLSSHSNTFMIMIAVLKALIKEETCVKTFSYFFVCLFSFVSFLWMHCRLAVFLWPVVLNLRHHVIKGSEKDEWKKHLFVGRKHGELEGVLTTDLNHVKPSIQQFMSCCVGLRQSRYVSSSCLFMRFCSPGFARFPLHKS